jgi:hypothetical protein
LETAMNDSELDRNVAAAFQVTDTGSDALSARLRAVQAGIRRQTWPERTRSSEFAPRAVIGVAATLILVFGLVGFPRIIHPVSAGAAVRQALSRVNTWHLKGWKTLDGRKVEWEVWGRRSPFFYREQVGTNVVVDDGTQRLSIYGPSKDGYQLKGVCLRLPSLQDAENVPWSYRQMVLQWRSALNPWKQTPQGPVFNFNGVNIDGYHVKSDNLYSIDGRTSLPIRYEKRTMDVDRDKNYTTVALLDADYDSPVPANTSLTTPPAGYREFDALAPSTGLPTQNEVAGTVIPAEQGDVHFQASPKVLLSTAPLDPSVVHDDQGRAYSAVTWWPLSWGNPDRNTMLMLFVPREPLASGAAPPRTLIAEFDTSVVAGWGAPDRSILRQDMTVTASLPKPGPPLVKAIAPYSRPDGRPRSNNYISYGGFDNLETAIYIARAWGYGQHSDSRTPNTAALRRQNYWSERAIVTANNLRVQMYREDLARTYRAIGNKARARRLLHDMLSEKRYLKLQCPPFDRSPEGYRAANNQLREWNQQYYRDARNMLAELDKGGK